MKGIPFALTLVSSLLPSVEAVLEANGVKHEPDKVDVYDAIEILRGAIAQVTGKVK